MICTEQGTANTTKRQQVSKTRNRSSVPQPQPNNNAPAGNPSLDATLPVKVVAGADQHQTPIPTTLLLHQTKSSLRVPSLIHSGNDYLKWL